MTLLTPTDSRYYIKPRAVSFAENDLGDVNRVYVSIASGTTIMVYVPEDDLIPYDEDKEYQKWVLTGYPTKLATSDAYYIYARLSRSDNRAIILFSTKKYKVDGSIEGAEGENNPSDQYFYIPIGSLTTSEDEEGKTVSRVLTFDSGKLSTPDNSYTKEETDSTFMSFEVADNRYLNALDDDTAQGIITFEKGLRLPFTPAEEEIENPEGGSLETQADGVEEGTDEKEDTEKVQNFKLINAVVSSDNVAQSELFTDNALLTAAAFNKLFTFMGAGTEEDPFWIRANYTLASVGSLSVLGLGNDSGQGGAGISYSRLDTWEGYDPATMAGYVLSAALGHDLLTRIENLPSDPSDPSDPFDPTGYATQTWVLNEALPPLKESIDATQQALNNFLTGSDTDDIINKWKELEAFLAGQTETSTLASLLEVKADKTELSKYALLETLADYATQAWVGKQGYIKSSDLDGYATIASVSNAIAVTDNLTDSNTGLTEGYIKSLKADNLSVSGTIAVGNLPVATQQHVADNYYNKTEISGIQAEINGGIAANKTAIEYLSEVFNKLFTFMGTGTEEDPFWIRANYTLASVGSLSVLGLGNDGGQGGTGISYSRLDTWEGYDPATMAGYVLSAALGHDLLTRIENLPSDPSDPTGYATQAWVLNEALPPLKEDIETAQQALSQKADKTELANYALLETLADYVTEQWVKQQGYEANVQSDWNVADTTSDAYIKNKPAIPTLASLMGSAAIGGTTSFIYWNGSAWESQSLDSYATTASVSKAISVTDYLTNTNTGLTDGYIKSFTADTLKVNGDFSGNGWSVEGSIAYFGELNATSVSVDGELEATSLSAPSITIDSLPVATEQHVADNYYDKDEITAIQAAINTEITANKDAILSLSTLLNKWFYEKNGVLYTSYPFASEKTVSVLGAGSGTGGSTGGSVSLDEVNSDILPVATDWYSIGSATLRWKELHAADINVSSINGVSLTGDSIATTSQLTSLRQGASSTTISGISGADNYTLYLLNGVTNSSTLAQIPSYYGRKFTDIESTGGLFLADEYMVNDILDYVDDAVGNVDVSASLENYYTKTQIDSKGFLTASSLSGYVTQVWVEQQGYEANVQSDWNVADTTSDAYIKNKPAIPTLASLMGSAAIGSATSFIYWNGSAWKTQSLSTYATLDDVTAVYDYIDGIDFSSYLTDYATKEWVGDNYYTATQIDNKLISFVTLEGDTATWARHHIFQDGTIYPITVNGVGDRTGINFTKDGTLWGKLGFSAVNTPAFFTTEGSAETLATQSWVEGKDYLLSSSFNKANIKSTLGISDWALAASKPSYAWSEITSKPTFATVATSGSYDDLSDTPTIPTVVNNLTTSNAKNALSAAQGVELKKLTDANAADILTIAEALQDYATTDQLPTLNSLMGSSAIGSTTSFIWWNGSAWKIQSLSTYATLDDVTAVYDYIDGIDFSSYLTDYATKEWVGDNYYTATQIDNKLIPFVTLEGGTAVWARHHIFQDSTVYPITVNGIGDRTGINFTKGGASWGKLGFSAVNTPAFFTTEGSAETLATQSWVEDSYLPLAGGELTDNATIKLSHYTLRTATIYGDGIYYKLSDTSGGANVGLWLNDNVLIYANANNGVITRYGIGGTTSSPLVKIDITGDITLSKDALIKWADGNGDYNWSTNLGKGFKIIDYNTNASVNEYSVGIHIGGAYYNAQLAYNFSSKHWKYRTGSSSSFGDWKWLIDSTGGTIDGNLTVKGSLTAEADIFGNGWSVEGGIANFGELNATDIYADSITVGDSPIATQSWVSGNASVAKKLFSKNDYQWYVVLLCKKGINTSKTGHRLTGKLYTQYTGSQRYYAADVDFWYSNWNNGENINICFDTYGVTGTQWDIVSVTYQGTAYYALRFRNTQAIDAYFLGTSKDMLFTAIHYYTSNTQTVVNSEIYNSIAEVSYNGRTAKGSLTVNGSITTSSKLTINNGASLEVQGNAFIGGTLYAGLSTSNPYATQSWVTGKGYATTTQLANYLPLSGGTMTGDLTIGKNASIKVTDSADNTIFAFQLNSTNNFLIGQYTAIRGYKTLIYGNEIRLCYGSYGSSSYTALFVNSSGNVGIGTTSPSYKLHVNGTSAFNDSMEILNGDLLGYDENNTQTWSITPDGSADFTSLSVGDTSVASKSYTIPAVSAKRWVRIAEMTSYISCGTITISKNYNSVPNQHAVFHVQSGYVQNNDIKAEYNITQLACTCNPNSDQYFTRVRIVYANQTTSSQKAYVEVYCNFVSTETLKVSLSGCIGMSLLPTYTLGSVPTDYDYRSIHLQPGGARNECYQMIDLTPYHLGTKKTYSELPTKTSATPPSVGDIWIVTEAYNGNPANTKWKWNGSTWVALASNTFTYSPDTFYPVVGSKLSASGGFTRIEVRNNLNNELENNVPSWSTHTRGFTANMVIYARGSEWGVNVGQTFCVDYNYLHTAKNPVGYSQMTNASLPVLWLRGGGKYNVYTDRLMRWNIKTSSFTVASQSVSPQSGGTAIFSFTKANLYANMVGYATESKVISLISDFNTEEIKSTYLPLAGGVMTGALNIKQHGYTQSIYGNSDGELVISGSEFIRLDNDIITQYSIWGNSLSLCDTTNGETITKNGYKLYNKYKSWFDDTVEIHGSELYGYDSIGDEIWYIDTDGSASFLSVSQTSDLTRKNILSYDPQFSVRDIANAPIAYFTWREGRDTTSQHLGSIAQYWSLLAPECVHGTEGNDMSMEYATLGLVTSIINAREIVRIADQATATDSQLNAALQRIADLEAEVAALHSRLGDLPPG